MKFILLTLVLPLLLTKAEDNNCPALPGCDNSGKCSSSRQLSLIEMKMFAENGQACIEDMKYVVGISGHLPEYFKYLEQRFSEYYYGGRCRQCIWVYCGLIEQSYGPGMAQSVCSYHMQAEKINF